MNARRMMLVMLIWITLNGGCGVGPRTAETSSQPAGESTEKTSEKGSVRLTVRVRPRQPRLSDLIEVDVEVQAQPGIDIKPPAFGQATGDFLVRDYGERKALRSSGQATNETTTHNFRYQLEPVSTGRHLIRSIAVEFTDRRDQSEHQGATSVIESDPIEIEVTSELGDQVPNLANLEPMLPPRPVEQSSAIVWATVALAMLPIIAWAVWFLRKRKPGGIEPPEQTPQQIAHAAFKALLSENLPGRGQFKEFYVRLTGIVRNFIEGTTGLRAPEQTTEEFLEAMRSREIFAPNQSVRLKEFLEAADMVKYAGQQPDQAQIDQSIDRAREFVDFHESPDKVTTDLSPVQQEV